MKRPENSPKTDETAELTPEQEAKILFSLRSEASSFVPDKLLDALKACHVETSLDEKSEKAIVMALQESKFAPNELPFIEKATGAFDPLKDKENFALTVKVRNEGAEIVPNVEDKIYKETGVKKHFSFASFLKSHWLPLASGTAALALTISAVAVVLSSSSSAAINGTYITVSLVPASHAVTSACEDEETFSSKVNNYEPSWSFSADSQNVISAYSCDNHSATLALKNYEPAFASKKAYEAISDLVTPAHINGYLETKDPEAKNVINITATSTDSAYGNTYSSAYESALDAALTKSSNKIYAVINFAVISIDKESLRGLSAKMAGTVASLYSSFHGLKAKDAVTLRELKESNSEVLTTLEAAVNAGKEAKLSGKGLAAFKAGLAKSYHLYRHNETPAYTASQIEEMRHELINDVSAVPWFCESRSQLEGLLQNDAYFIMDDDLGFSEDQDSSWYLYAQIRDYILKTKTMGTDSYVQYLNEVKALAANGKESTGYLPDNSQEDIDNGGHLPGDGPANGEDWGEGGGEWHGPNGA